MICDCEHGPPERDGKHRAAGCTAAPVGRFITGGRIQNLCQECAGLDPDTKPAIKYKVHAFCVVRVPVEVESDSHQEAIKEACSQHRIDFYRLFEDVKGTDSEYAEEITEFLVDEVEDTEHHKSKWYEADGVTEMSDHYRAAKFEEAHRCKDCGGSGVVQALGPQGETGPITAEMCEKCQGTGMDIAQAEAVAEQQGQDWASAGEDQNAGKHF